MPQVLSQQTIPRSSQRQMADNSVVLLITMMVGIKEFIVCLQKKILKTVSSVKYKVPGCFKACFSLSLAGKS